MLIVFMIVSVTEVRISCFLKNRVTFYLRNCTVEQLAIKFKPCYIPSTVLWLRYVRMVLLCTLLCCRHVDVVVKMINHR